MNVNEIVGRLYVDLEEARCQNRELVRMLAIAEGTKSVRPRNPERQVTEAPPDGMTDEEFAQTVQITREPLPDGMRQAAARLTEEAMAGTAPTGPHPEFPVMSDQPVPGTSGAPNEPPPTGRPDRPPAQIQHPTRGG